MNTPAPKMPAPPLGIIPSLVSGFEAVNARLELVLLPLLLDLFLWLGPHLSVQPLVERWLALMQTVMAGAEADATMLEQMDMARQVFTEYGARFNLFSVWSVASLGLSSALNMILAFMVSMADMTDQSFVALGTAPLSLGVPSLMAVRSPVTGPLGTPMIWPVSDPLVYLFLLGSFTLFGLFLGAFYYGSVAQQVRDARRDWRVVWQQVWGNWLRLIVLVAAFFMAAFPVLLVVSLLSVFSPLLGGLVLMAASVLALWILFYTSFAVPGIVLQRRGLWGALWDSLRLVQWSFPSTFGMYTVVVLLGLGLGMLWNVPSADSWLTLVAVLGHAVVSTALVAAVFAYYKDRYRWWLEMRQMLQARAAAQPGARK